MKETSQSNIEEKNAFFAGLELGKEFGGVVILNQHDFEDKIWHSYCKFRLLGNSRIPRLKELL